MVANKSLFRLAKEAEILKMKKIKPCPYGISLLPPTGLFAGSSGIAAVLSQLRLMLSHPEFNNGYGVFGCKFFVIHTNFYSPHMTL